ncbi:Sld3 protein [Saccharomycopsis crataegensis]|uniref:Sld3 protein n=1 Tax=Saccharomycopsis crataegensis TaxID=43959 RepID=A0AAV5QKW2_9ASCO|nr:Sld3 protein [Saccharomycopsis crataegensis]
MESFLYKALQNHANDETSRRKSWLISDPISLIQPKTSNPNLHHNITSGFLIPPSKSPNKRKVELHNAYDQEFNFTTGEESAGEYLTKKYRESMYFSKMPLYYFPKTSISRLESVYLGSKKGEVLSANKKDELKKLIEASIMDIESFDQRHKTLGIIITKGEDVGKLDEKEQIFLKNFSTANKVDYLRGLKLQNLNKSDSTASKIAINMIDELLDNYTLFLKIREAQLQALLLVEYLYLDISDIASSRTLVEEKDTIIGNIPTTSFGLGVNPKKRNLIRPKRTKNKKTKESKASNSKRQNIKKTGVFYRSLLNAYIDRFLIWDIILETKVGNKRSDKQNNQDETGQQENLDGIDTNVLASEFVFSRNYVKKVVIPYFYQKCPHLVKFMRNKIHGELVGGSSHNKKREIKKDEEKMAEGDNGEPKDTQKNKTLKRSRTELNIEKPRGPSLLRSKTIANKFALEINKNLTNNKSLKRASSTSSMPTSGIAKLLSKREVDLSSKSKPSPKLSVGQKLKEISSQSFTDPHSILRRPKLLQKSKSLIDNSKILKTKAPASKSIQIEATPIKNNSSNPYNNPYNNSNQTVSFKKSLIRQFSQIEATPELNNRVINALGDSPYIVDSPPSSIRITSSLTERIYSTPTQNKILEEIFSPDTHFMDEQITPPRKTAPNRSFLADLNGSPTNTYIRKHNDTQKD